MDGDGGAAAVLEAPASTGAATGTETPVGESQPTKTQTEPSQSTDTNKQQTDKTDARRNPDAIRKTLKSLRDNPETAPIADEFGKALNENKSFKTVWPTVREAREGKAALDAIGGAAKVAELQTYATSMREVDEMLEAGDPRAVDKIMETGPKGLVKILPALIEKLAAVDAQGISGVIEPHAITYLASQGLPRALAAIVSAFKAKNYDGAAAGIDDIVNWYNGKTEGKEPGSDKPPEQAAWEKERDGYQQKEFAGSVKSAFDAAMTHTETSIDKELAVQAKEYGLTDEVLTVIRNDVWKRIEKERNADPLFKSTIGSKVNERTRKVDPSTGDYLKSQVDQRVKDAVRLELRIRYGFIKAKSATVDPNNKSDVTAAPAGTVISIDHAQTLKKYGSRVAAQDAIMSGKAVNSAGKPIVKQGKVWKLA